MRSFFAEQLLVAVGLVLSAALLLRLPLARANFGFMQPAPYNMIQPPLFNIPPGEKPPYDASPMYLADAYRTPQTYQQPMYRPPGPVYQPPNTYYPPPRYTANQIPNPYMRKVVAPRGMVAETLTAEASLGRNLYKQDSYKEPSPGYDASGKCDPSYQSNCVVDAKIKCHGDYIDVEIEFERYFSGLVYVWSKYDDCNLYKPPPYGRGSKLVTFKLTKDTCPSYEGYVDAEGEDNLEKTSSPQKEYKGRNFNIVIQFDQYIVSHDDVSFVARCDQAEEGPRKVFFSYTVVDQYPVLIAGLMTKSKLSVEVKKGTSAYGPDLFGPIKVGDSLSLVLKLRGYTKDYEMRVASCWASVGPPLSEKFRKLYGGGVQQNALYDKTRSIEMISEDCSLKPKLIGNFEKVAVQDQGKSSDDSYTIVKFVTLRAFRFPKSDNVIFRCKVDVCQESCGAYGACKPVYLDRKTKSTFGYGKYPIVKPMAGYAHMGQAVSYGSSDDTATYKPPDTQPPATYVAPKPQPAPAPFTMPPPQAPVTAYPAPKPQPPAATYEAPKPQPTYPNPQVPYKTKEQHSGYQPTQRNSAIETEKPQQSPIKAQPQVYQQPAPSTAPPEVYQQQEQQIDLRAYETSDYEQLPPYASEKWKQANIKDGDYELEPYTAPPQPAPAYPQPVTYNQQPPQPMPPQPPSEKYPRNEYKMPANYQQPAYQNKPTPPNDYKKPTDYQPPAYPQPSSPSDYKKPANYQQPAYQQPSPPAQYQQQPVYQTPNVPSDYKKPENYQQPGYQKPNPPNDYTRPADYQQPAYQQPSPPSDYKKPANYQQPMNQKQNYAPMMPNAPIASQQNYIGQPTPKAAPYQQQPYQPVKEAASQCDSRRVQGVSSQLTGEKKHKRSTGSDDSPGPQKRTAEVVPVDSFIIEQEFNLDVFSAGLKGNFESEKRIRRFAHGTPTIRLNDSASVWADCTEYAVTLKLEAPEGFNGTLSLKSHGKDDDNCTANKTLWDLKEIELSLETPTCNPHDRLFIATVSDGDFIRTETIDCYEEELLVGADDVDEEEIEKSFKDEAATTSSNYASSALTSTRTR